MGQPRFAGIVAAAAVIVVAAVLIETQHAAPAPAPVAASTQKSSGARVASITPAGTDLMIGLGEGDRLVGISNYDDDRDGVVGKPRIGDYENINWEKLSGLNANLLLVQYAADRMPTYVRQQCGIMGIRILNLKLDTIDEILNGMTTLGGAVGDPGAGKQAAEGLRHKLDTVRQRVLGRRPVRAIVVTGDDSFSLAGPGEFLDQILTIAGGVNAASKLGQPYPAVDQEMILTMAPDVVIRLVPDGDHKPQVVEQGNRIWDALTGVPAVRNHRVYVLTEWYCELPGFRIGDLAMKFADCLHPEAATTRP
jgi:iron complex transport system substrate-binding protein